MLLQLKLIFESITYQTDQMTTRDALDALISECLDKPETFQQLPVGCPYVLYKDKKYWVVFPATYTSGEYTQELKVFTIPKSAKERINA
jgi:hypothetical protein